MKKILLIALTVFIALILSCFFYYFYILNKKINIGEQEFTVKQGEPTSEIANRLKEKNIISSALIFEIYIKKNKLLLQIGVYTISGKNSIKEIANIISQGKTVENTYLIPEGWRVTQIDEYLSLKGVIKQGELTKIAASSEGYLFPDTYRFLHDSDPEVIKKTMLENFDAKIKDMKLSRETVILASIVEREAKLDEDRPKIAGVYLNRLEKNMRLEADPTVQYAKGSWDPIKVSDYRSVDSPYNTYLNAGLPPGPICNPGLKSLQAALYPEKIDALYFFQTKDGHTIYSTSLEEHERKLEENR